MTATWAELFERAADREVTVEAVREALRRRRRGDPGDGGGGRDGRDGRDGGDDGDDGRDDPDDGGDGRRGRDERDDDVTDGDDRVGRDDDGDDRDDRVGRDDDGDDRDDPDDDGVDGRAGRGGRAGGGDADAGARGATAMAGERPDPARVVAGADVLAADLLAGGPAREALDVVRGHSWVELVASDPLLAAAEAVIADLAGAGLAGDWRRTAQALRVRVDQPAGDHPALASVRAGRAAHLLTFDERLQGAAAGVALRERLPANTSVKPPAAFVRLFDPAALYPEVVGGTYPGPDRDPRA